MLSISSYTCCLLGITIYNVVDLSVWPDCFTWKVLAGPMSSYYINPFTQRSKDDLIFASVGCVDCKAFFEDSKSNIMQNLFALEKILALARFKRVPVEMKISKVYALLSELKVGESAYFSNPVKRYDRFLTLDKIIDDYRVIN